MVKYYRAIYKEHYSTGVMLFKNMKVEKMTQGSAFITADKTEIEIYPAWSATQLAHIRVNDEKNKRWTDCWLSAIVKNGKVRFDLHHERGYPSEQKGQVLKSITACWLNEQPPTLG